MHCREQLVFPTHAHLSWCQPCLNVPLVCTYETPLLEFYISLENYIIIVMEPVPSMNSMGFQDFTSSTWRQEVTEQQHQKHFAESGRQSTEDVVKPQWFGSF